ncbi:unnamed protein product [Rhizophagus irregularis]|nr:unnamed protein product [Rhizophagus irregularis]
MLNMGDSVGNTFEEDFLKFVSKEGETFLSRMTFQLGQFVENSFLKKLFDKGPLTMDKTALLIDMFGASKALNGLDGLDWSGLGSNLRPD